MSQYEVIQDQKKYMFGWDQPLNTYFLQVHDLTKPEDEQIVCWLGADPATQMYEVEDLVEEAMKEGLDIPYRIQVELHEDKDDGR